jgi:hypothetical protein
MQGGGARPAVAPKAEDRAPGKDAEVVAAGPAKIAAKIAAKSGPEKSGPEKKAPAAESETTNAGARSSAEPAAVTMSLAMSLAMPLPVLPEAFAPAVQGAKGGPGGSIALVGKPAVLRGREAKIAGAGAHAPAAAGKALEGGVPAGAAGVSGAASTGPVAAGPVATGTAAPGGSGGLGGTAAAAPAPVLAAPEVVASGGAGGGKTVESGPRTGMSAGPAMHDEMAGALPASGTALGEPRTLVTTSNVLEVGITGGAHGWLRVRAELEHTGEVTASLVASSAASADALHKELGAMSAYLKSEVVGVSSRRGARAGVAGKRGSGQFGSRAGRRRNAGARRQGRCETVVVGWVRRSAERARIRVWKPGCAGVLDGSRRWGMVECAGLMDSRRNDR